MKIKKMSVLTAAAMAACLTGCGDSGSGTEVSQTTIPATTTAGVEINTEVLNEEDKSKVADAADNLLSDEELENKTIKWLAHYDINPNSAGNSKSVQLEMFESKYGGEVKYYPSTWDTLYSDLSTYILGGEGIDFFPFDVQALPKGVVNGMFQSIDDYTDIDSDLWADNRNVMEIFNFSGKHYVICTNVTPFSICYYNKQTIEENGLDDPWELYEAGNWNWDTFKDMLLNFVDPAADHYGLDGWYYQNSLTLSGGMPAVSSKDGVLQLNLYEPALERTMTFAEDLYKNGLTMDLSMFDWSEQPQFMGEGKELFYLAGAWHTYSDPSIWATKVPPQNMGIVPVPCSKDGDQSYGITCEGYLLCKGAANPIGVARFAECGLASALDPQTKEIGDQKTRDDYGWTDEMLEHYDECCRLAREYPLYELGSGVSNDFDTIVTKYATYEPFRGGTYSTLREEVESTAELLLEEVNSSLKDMAK
ncbi:MAG: extracellular solute-binding protein [Oscillospiraceae bacterium]|nr:extracellular solute-binding protein [Oscillospiraceae bacterium]